jgi:large subunit ribosomal protein L21
MVLGALHKTWLKRVSSPGRGGKQYRVEEGGVLNVEKIAGKKAGDTVVFDEVLLLDDGKSTKLGTPFIEGASVEVTLEQEGRGKKLHIQKFKSKSRYKRRLGHRQAFAKVVVKKIK